MKRLVAALALLLPLEATAHPLAPGLLELTQVAPTRYAVLWRTPVVRSGAITVEPRLPTECIATAPPSVQPGSAEVMTARWLVECAGGLEGKTLAVDGLPGSGINVIVRVAGQDGSVFQALLGADQAAVIVNLAAEPVFRHYVALGAEHLLAGLDHVLFLLGLFLLVGAAPVGAPPVGAAHVGAAHGREALRKLMFTVTAFTAGHSITLGAVTVGFGPLPQAVAETLIAATVLVLALELSRPWAAPTSAGVGLSLLRRRPALMAAVFGLIHGLGFAGALREIGLPAQDLPLALLGFNVGIELGQLALVAALWLGAQALRARPVPRAAHAVPAYLIGSMAACWLLERAAGLLA
jgi:hypothetical protein